MPWFKSVLNPRDVRDLGPVHAEWVSKGNPKAGAWVAISDPPSAVARWDGAQWVEPDLAAREADRVEREQMLVRLDAIIGDAAMTAPQVRAAVIDLARIVRRVMRSR